MRPLLEYINKHLSIITKFKIVLFKKKTKDFLVNLSIKISKKNKDNYNEFMTMIDQELTTDEKMFTQSLIEHAIHRDEKLFKMVMKHICSHERPRNISKIMSVLSAEDQIYLLKEIMYACDVKFRMFKKIDIDIKEKVFIECYNQLIGREKLIQTTIKHLNRNLYQLYRSLNKSKTFKTTEYLQRHTEIGAWLDRINQEPKRLNQFYLTAIPEDLSRYLFGIKDEEKRLTYIYKIRTAEAALNAKKNIHLSKIKIQSYF
jgi:hypothetical protein